MVNDAESHRAERVASADKGENRGNSRYKQDERHTHAPIRSRYLRNISIACTAVAYRMPMSIPSLMTFCTNAGSRTPQYLIAVKSAMDPRNCSR